MSGINKLAGKSEATENAAAAATDCYFGGCPYCGNTDGFFNVHRAHFFVCHQHRVKWFVGDNLFRKWRLETRGDWDRNLEKFGGYVDVEPIYPANETSQPPDRSPCEGPVIRNDEKAQDQAEKTIGLELTQDVWTALYRVLNYQWGDEYRDYCACSEHDRPGHIFESMRLVRHWLDDVTQGPKHPRQHS